MSKRRELISNALSFRFREVCGERLRRFAPETFGEMASFVSLVSEQLQNASPADLKNLTSFERAPAGWLVSERDCLASLCALSTGEPAELKPGQPPPLESFLEDFAASRQDPALRFQLLAERYRWPLNFCLGAEAEVRERVLTALMVHDRVRLEKTSPVASESSDFWLRLNLVAVYSARVPDLRFLDALNYYYELLFPAEQPQTQHDWLQISYLALYARALAAWI